MSCPESPGTPAPSTGAFCEVCGDWGGATSLIVCENSSLGCPSGQHLYCFVPVRQMADLQGEFYCSLCTAHRADAERQAKRRRIEAEGREAARVLPSVALPSRKPPRQAVKGAGTTGQLPAGGEVPAASKVAQPPPAAPRKAPILPAAKSTLVDLLNGFAAEDEKAREQHKATLDGTRAHWAEDGLSEREVAMDALCEELQLCVDDGGLWRGTVQFDAGQGDRSALTMVAYPKSRATERDSLEAASRLPSYLSNSMRFNQEELELGSRREAGFEEACLVLGCGAVPNSPGFLAALERWQAVWQQLATRHEALEFQMEETPGSYLLLVPNRLTPESCTYFGLLGQRCTDKPKQPRLPDAGILKKACSSSRGQVNWPDAHPAAVCELGPGVHYSSVPGGSRGNDLASKTLRPPLSNAPSPEQEFKPLSGLRIATVAMDSNHERTRKALDQLRSMGAQFFATPFPWCEDIVCISGRLIQKGELGVCKGELGPSPGAFDVSGCLAAKPPVMVFEDLAVLEEIVRQKRRLTEEEYSMGRLRRLFPYGIVVLVDVKTVDKMPASALQQVLDKLEQRAAQQPGYKWELVVSPDDMRAWEASAVATHSGALLALFRSSSAARVLRLDETSQSAKDEQRPVIRNAIKLAYIHRYTCRHVFLLSSDSATLKAASANSTISLGSIQELVAFLRDL